MNDNTKQEKYILSIDAESDGLWGEIFAIGAIVYDSRGEEVDSFSLRVDDDYVCNRWCKENILPHINHMEFADSMDDLLERFAGFYNKYRESCDVLWHMGHVVESYLFRCCVDRGLIGMWDAPYTPIELSTILRANKLPVDTIDYMVDDKDLSVANSVPHDPLYDCEVAAKVYFYLRSNGWEN